MKTSMKHALGQLLLLGATLLPLAPQAETGAMPQEVQINGVEFVLIPAGWFYKSGGQTVDNAPATLLDNEGGGRSRSGWPPTTSPNTRHAPGTWFVS